MTTANRTIQYVTQRMRVVRIAMLVANIALIFRLTGYTSSNAAIAGRFSRSYFVLLSMATACVIVMTILLQTTSAAERLARLASRPLIWATPIAWPTATLLVISLADYLTRRQFHWAIWTAFGRWGLLVSLAWLGLVLDYLWAFIRSHWHQATLSAVSVAMTLSMLESGARLWLERFASPEQQVIYGLAPRDADTAIYSPHHYLNYVTTPNYDDDINRHDSYGFRGLEVEVPKPAGVFRIVAIGGSTTYSIKVHDWREAYPAVLETILRQTYGYDEIEVVNAGVGGYDSFESLINLQFRVLDLEPDLILVYHAHNDIHTRIVDPALYRGDNSARRKQWDLNNAALWEARLPSVVLRWLAINLGLSRPLTLDQIVSRQDCCIERDPDVPVSDLGGLTPRQALLANPPIYFERNLRNIVAVARAHGADVMLMTFAVNPNEWGIGSAPYYLEATLEHNAIIERLGTELDVRIFDFASAMPLDQEYWIGSIHFSATGEQVHASLIADYLVRSGLLPRQ